jgi:ABC-type glycerol-3-phosphate transport system permease component
MGVTILAAFGIGALRPFGRFSELLLILFSPWLFFTSLPLIMANFLGLREAGLLNTFDGLAPPVLVSIPILFVLTLFFKGQAWRWRNRGELSVGRFVTVVILPAIPVAAVLILFAVLTTEQELLYPLIVINDRALWPIPLVLIQLSGAFATNVQLLATAITVFTLTSWIISVVLLAVFYLVFADRLALGAGRFEPETAPSSNPSSPTVG